MRKTHLPGLPARVDGAPEAFAPAQKTKPWGRVMAPLVRLVRRFKPVTPDDESTRQGAPAAASPATVQAQLYAERYNRRDLIQDARILERTDVRVSKAISMYVREATRKGASVRVEGTGRLVKRAQAVADATIKRLPPAELRKLARALVVEGDLFVQMIVVDREVIGVQRLPAAAMERLSNDADEFENPERAYEQVDTTTNDTVATWPEALMCQVRWNHFPGDRYGMPEPAPLLETARKLGLLESSQAVRRMARASLARHWSFPLESKAEDLDDFMARNGMIEGKRDPWNPNEVLRDVVSKGGVTANTLEGDATVHEIDDLVYFDDLLCAGLPTPKGLYGRSAESINRDVLKDQREEWLKDGSRVTEALDELVRFCVDLALMLNGIDPNLITYSVVWSRNTAESQSEQIDGITRLREAKLASRRTAVSLAAEYTGVEDVDAELEQIDEEDEKLHERKADLLSRRTIPDPADEREIASPDRAPARGRSETDKE